MDKQQLRYFFAAFSLSFVFYIGVLGIFFADVHSRSRGFGDENALLLVENVSEDQADVVWMGREYTVDTSLLSDIGERAAPLRTLIPIRYRILPELYAFAEQEGWTSFLPFS
ncbi:hypothetical protein [Zongyangia hominis]|uniref:Uncharacterized protein n=1 Tax=Zongyangia hominis TaxID=2763677 RepID=A0A926E9H2_9FIRM|nr:hypothetical protein [Zongyangia hominis]MBC8570380.1 hypothetical protein [Zongyangia hominis]